MKNTNLKPAIKPIALAIATICLQPDLVLAEETSKNTLNNIVVTAQNSEQSAASVTGNLTVITREDIELKQYRNLKDAFTNVPGLQVSSNGGLGHVTSVYIRGSNKVLLLLDGVPLNDPTNINYLPAFESINLQDIERIEVLKGASSGIWGANASAGVINLISKTVKQGQYGDVSFAMGSDNFHQLSGGFGVKDQNGDISARFNSIKTDGFSQLKPYKSNERDFEKDGFNQSDFSVNFGVNFKEKHRFETLIKNSAMDADYDSAFFGEDDQNSNRQIDTLLKQLSYKYNFNNFDFNARINQLELNRDEGFGSMDSERNEQFISAGYKYQNNGYLQVYALANQAKFEGKDLKIKNGAIGLANTFTIKDITLSQSLRHDFYNEFEDKTTGSLGIATNADKNIRFSANAGTSYTSPSLYQLTYGATTGLKPETATSLDARLELWDFGITVFQNTVDDLIDYGGSWPNDHYFNVKGKTKFKGVELDYAKYYDSIKTEIAFATSFLDAKDEDNQQMARRAKNTSSIDITYLGFNKTSINLNTRYVGSKYDYRNGGTQQIGEYFVSDLAVDYKFNQMVSLNVKVINLFDKDYTDAVEAANGSTPTMVYANGGRQFMLRLTSKF